MTYHVVFDISERFPDALVGVVAIVGLALFAVMSTRQDWRRRLSRASWSWLGLAAFLWAVLHIRNLAGQFGLLFGALALIPLAVAAPAFLDRELRLNEYVHASARRVAPIVAVVMLAVLALEGYEQWPAMALKEHLTSGDVTVVTGTVQDAFNPNWGTEGFSVEGHSYSYQDSPYYVGFHQTAMNGGPIRNGLQVRVSSIGNVIVRLEIADGQ